VAPKIIAVWPGCHEFLQIVRTAVDVLRGGGLVAYPTDTLYGLAAHGLMPEAIEKVFAVKGRSSEKALPLLLAQDEQLDEMAIDISPVARRLAREFWPGALTLVVRRSSRVPDAVVGGGLTVALRVPHHAVPLGIVAALGAPITGTSANRSGGPLPRLASQVMDAIGTEVDLILDGGPCPGGIGSTVLDVTVNPPRILRLGEVTEAEITQVIACLKESD
jgi:L-threonylcarbamoyladenylate synthase